MHNIIQQIIDKKREDLAEEKKNDNKFRQAILKPKHGQVAIIAEVKFASPTNPNLGSPEQLLERVKEYEKSGADAISIITEKHFFKGSLGFVTRVKEVVNIPVLQKDFVIDEYQIYQAKSIGSDAILLIARLVDTETLKRFVEIALEIGIEPVVEINNEEDLKKAIATETSIIAVNARDLDTFEISVDKACNLLKKISEKYIKLGFSGINSKEEVNKYIESGVSGILVGTALMKAGNIDEFIGELR